MMSVSKRNSLPVVVRLAQGTEIDELLFLTVSKFRKVSEGYDYICVVL